MGSPGSARSLDAWVGALREPAFRRLWTGQAVSAIGDSMVPVALAFAVLEATGSATDLGLILAALSVPRLLFTLAGGVWGDRLSRRAVMLMTDLIRGAVQASCAGLLASGAARLWSLMALQAIYGAAQAIYSPTSVGLVPQIVSGARLQQANVLLGATRSSTKIIGAPVAGVLTVAFGGAAALGADAVTFLISATCLSTLPFDSRLRAEPKPFIHELVEGWREVRQRTWALTTIVYFAFFRLCGFSPFFVLGPLIARQHLGGAAAWATILTGSGIGALLGGAIALRWQPRRPLRAGIAIAGLWALPLALLGTTNAVVLVAAAAVVASAAITIADAWWETLLQEQVPQRVLSRISSYDWLGTLAFAPLGLALTVPFAGAAGGDRAAAVILAAAVCALVVATLAVPSVRRLARNSPTVEAEAPIAHAGSVT